MPPRIGGGSTPAKIAPPQVKPATAASPPAEAKPAKTTDSNYATDQKPRGPNMTGRHKPVTKPPVPVKKELVGDVAKLRAAAAAGGAAKPKLDPEVKGALDRIKLVQHQGKDAIGDVMKGLEPAVAREVFKNLPSQVRAEVGMATPFGFAPAPMRMAQVQDMSDAQLQQVAEHMRAGLVEDLGLQLAVTTELAARTQWGKDNPDLVDYQRQLVVDGKVNFKDGRGAGRTETSGEVTMDPSLSRSPEALAALLAHEATHSHHAANGGMDPSVYVEETAGNMASAQVWAELGKKDDSNLSKDQLDGLNEYAEQFKAHGEDGVQARMAAEYAMEASKLYAKGNKASEKAKVTDVLDHLANDPGAVKAMRPEYAKELFLALMRTGPSEDQVKKLGELFKNLPPSAKLQLPGLVKDMDKAAREVLFNAMKG